MRVVVLGERCGWHVERLTTALERRGHDASVVAWGELGAAVTSHGPGFLPRAIEQADVIVVRGMPGGRSPTDRLEEVIFRMDVLGRLEAAGTPVINRPRALEIAIDKYLSLAVMAGAGVPVPHTLVVQSADDARSACAQLGGTCVAKPLFGSRGQGIVRIASPEEAASAGAQGVIYLQEFLDHPGWDARILVVGSEVHAMRRIAPPGEWRTNVALGGRPEPFIAPPEWIDLARRSAAALGADIAGVDLIPTPQGPVVVEVNAVPGWRGLQTVCDADLAERVASTLERAAQAGL